MGLNMGIAGEKEGITRLASVTLTQQKGLDTPGGRCDLACDPPTGTQRTSHRPVEYEIPPEMVQMGLNKG